MSTTARGRVLKRRTKPSLAGHVRTFWVLAMFGLAVLCMLGFAVANAPQLRVRTIDANVPSGGPVTKSAAIAAARIDPDANLWLLNTGAIRGVEACLRSERRRPARAISATTVVLGALREQAAACIVERHRHDGATARARGELRVR